MGLIRNLGVITKKNYGDLTREDLKSQIKREWGSLLEAKSCPVWISEFGASPDNDFEMKWMEIFVEILREMDADWAYWPLNVGEKPGVGGDEAYGMIADDWTPKPSGDNRLALLAKIGLTPGKAEYSQKESGEEPRRRSRVSTVFGGKDPLSGVKSGTNLAALCVPCSAGISNRRRTATHRRTSEPSMKGNHSSLQSLLGLHKSESAPNSSEPWTVVEMSHPT